MSERSATLHPGAVFAGLSQQSYVQHRLHAPDRIWPEKNCYIDIWIEVVHCLGLAPEAMLGFTLGVDFEGDQWTFFKPSHDELRGLFGIDVQELTVWRPLIDHAEEADRSSAWPAGSSPTRCSRDSRAPTRSSGVPRCCATST